MQEPEELIYDEKKNELIFFKATGYHFLFIIVHGQGFLGIYLFSVNCRTSSTITGAYIECPNF
jgi:hypothetical protein